MIEKIKAILGSIRFWQLVIGALIVILGKEGVISQAIADAIAGILGISVTIGTVDKAAQQLGGNYEQNE